MSSTSRSKTFKGFVLGVMVTVALMSPFIFMRPLEVRQVGTFYSNDQLVFNALWGEVYGTYGQASDTKFVYVLSYEIIDAKALMILFEYNELAFVFDGIMIDLNGDKTFLDNSDVYDGYSTTFYDVGSAVLRIVVFGDCLEKSGLLHIYTTPVG